MRKLILSLVAAIAALAVAGPASAATKVISIYGSGFSPKSTTITEGDTVTWKNRDNANHQVLADKGQFVSPDHPARTRRSRSRSVPRAPTPTRTSCIRS